MSSGVDILKRTLCPRIAGKRRLRHKCPLSDLRLFHRRSCEVNGVWMMKDQRAHAGLGLHHHALGKMAANLFRPEQFPDALLVVEIRTRRVAEAIALAAIAR